MRRNNPRPSRFSREPPLPRLGRRVCGRRYRGRTPGRAHRTRTIPIFPCCAPSRISRPESIPAALAPARDAIVAAEHIVIVFPLWLGTMPALVKAFFEQAMRPGIAFEYRKQGFPKQLLAGRSARLVVTMGMPALIYRWYFRGSRAAWPRTQRTALRRYEAGTRNADRRRGGGRRSSATELAGSYEEIRPAALITQPLSLAGRFQRIAVTNSIRWVFGM